MVAALQEYARKFGYHIALGGGVLNRLQSDKDLDLFFLPMQNGETTDPEQLLVLLEAGWSKLEPFSTYVMEDDGIWTFKGKMDCSGKRIDIWIM